MKNALHGERGAVNILFLILVLVIAIAFIVLWFTQLQENEALVAREAKAASAEKRAVARANYQTEWYGRFAKTIGAGVPAVMEIADEDIHSDPPKPVADATQRIEEQIRVQLGSVERLAGSPGARPETIHAAWDVFVARLRALEGEISQRDQRIAALQAQVTELNNANAAAARQFDDTVRALREEKGGDDSRNKAQIEALREQVAQLQTGIDEAQATTKTVRDEKVAEVTAAANKAKALDEQVEVIKTARNIARRLEAPDGKILSIDRSRGIAFVDLTSKQQLHAGLRFRVQEDTKGGLVHKGYLRIVSVGPNMSEARIEDESAAGGGMGIGDLISNPVFRKGGESVRFAFLGQLPGRYNRETAEGLLKDLGATVDASVSVRTDFLVLGENESEEDAPLAEDPNYQNALRWGIQVITEKDLSPFLQR